MFQDRKRYEQLLKTKHSAMRNIERIFIHCTASSNTATRESILNEFQRRGWRNPGYHYLVEAKGTVHQLLDEKEVSNGVMGYNATAINIAYIGGVNAEGKLPTHARLNKRQPLFISFLS